MVKLTLVSQPPYGASFAKLEPGHIGRGSFGTVALRTDTGGIALPSGVNKPTSFFGESYVDLGVVNVDELRK